MKTDVIRISSTGKGMEAALDQADKVSAYKGLTGKAAIHLRLLTEEMMGMMRGITGETEGEFWIEDEKQVYRLHLLVNTHMDLDKREQLLSAASSGKNEAARGLMGRLRDFFDRGTDTFVPPLYFPDSAEDLSFSQMAWEWSMRQYRDALQDQIAEDANAREMWDELEKSVVTHVADDIKVSIHGRQAEMIIEKKMPIESAR